jgi:hypothetical protein
MKFRFVRTVGVGVAVAAAAAVTVTGLPGSPMGATAASAGSPSYSLSYQTYPDGKKVVARWNPCQPAVTYKVNPKFAAKTKKGRKSAIKDVRRAVARLSGETGINFRYVGRTSRIPKNVGSTGWAERMPDVELDIAWVKQSRRKGRTDLLGTAGRGYAAGTGGYSYKFWRVGDEPWRGVSGRGFVVLDSSQNKKFRKGFGAGTTRGDLLLHELGHVVGLNHVGSDDEVMYPTIIRRGSAGYHAGDRKGLSRLGRSQGCIDVPGWIWKDLS